MTLADFYIEVLRTLKVVPPNGTAYPEDRQRVEDTYPGVHAYLLTRSLLPFGVTEDIPNEYVIPLKKILAYQLTEEFSVPDLLLTKLKMEGELDAQPVSKAERQLRKLKDEDYVEHNVRADYF